MGHICRSSPITQGKGCGTFSIILQHTIPITVVTKWIKYVHPSRGKLTTDHHTPRQDKPKCKDNDFIS